MRVAVIIVAGGSGVRFGAEIPKALVELGGKPLVRWSVEAFCGIDDVESIVVLAPEDFEVRFEAVLSDLSKKVIIGTGGETRTDSVRNGIALVPDGCDTVAIHDAARPLVKTEDIRAVLEAANEHGAATIATPVSDTLKIVEDETIIETVDRSKYWAIQTPQVFRFDMYKRALERAKISPTDDCGIVEDYGYPVKVIAGSRLNIKITYPEDLFVAEAILKGRRCK